MSIRRLLLAGPRPLVAGSALLLAAAVLAGCAPVAPHERGRLARRSMEIGGNKDLTFGEEHAQSYREGSTGGGTARGGGCGCN